MSNSDRLIVVTGVTGQQGGAATRHLLRDGWSIRGITRDTSKPAARALADAGVEIVEGNLNDSASIERAVQGAYGVFGVQTPYEEGTEAELHQGRTLADLVKAAGVQHFVYSSVGGADRNSGVPHFESKAEIERHIQSLDLPYTILQPVFFMDNFERFASPTVGPDGSLQLSMAMPTEVPLQMIAADDIGAFVAIAFGKREEYLGRSLELAGDELTLPAAVQAMSEAIGKPIQYVPLPVDVVRQFSEDTALMFEWFTTSGYEADIPALRRIYPALTDFRTYLQRAGWTPERQFAAPQYA